ncbi:hypothetical protein [Sinomonas terrae]|uniref:Uncharacterized protein n=1 Tax=Sinomonas terrae TaxID=2908838 RepID=A0ABS9TXS1_9MICC|nr:hypothetical protein [Sinomonas terrae]MCH6469214.1 hypothetical protein [Sinomonas terrae]
MALADGVTLADEELLGELAIEAGPDEDANDDTPPPTVEAGVPPHPAKATASAVAAKPRKYEAALIRTISPKRPLPKAINQDAGCSFSPRVAARKHFLIALRVLR